MNILSFMIIVLAINSIIDGHNPNQILSSAMSSILCDTYEACGAFGICISTGQVCQCLKGFSPKSPQEWNSSNWAKGCVRIKPLSCYNEFSSETTDGFIKYEGLKVPDTNHTWVDERIDLDLCRYICLKNCSCMAYAVSDISSGSGCVIWFGDLIDIKQFPTGGQDLYIRMDASELGEYFVNISPKHLHDSSYSLFQFEDLLTFFSFHEDSLVQRGHYRRVRTIIASTIVAICVILLFCIHMVCWVRKNYADKSKIKDNIEKYLEDLDLPLFDLQTITTVTNNFSLNNKIGQGGFGPVYKGKLPDGLEVAVKRLSSSSRQGVTEFITEVKLIAELQHRNLVKLLGCCIREHEKILVYEYMVNGSLDSFIFDQIKGKLLDWPRRFHIIFGVAKGLLYLHQDSRLRIIHRDLKASNVLLDDKLNPKISDFGMARAFGGDQIEGNTNRIVGTYGYMAPEYAVDGLFSIKSDVFSFGIVLLEIICGIKNRALCHGNQTLNLVGYAWALWKQGNALQLMDSRINDSCIISEVLRCIHVSLLCVQQYPEDRPTMTSVVQMLGSEIELFEPREPGFFPRRTCDEGKLNSKKNNMISNDELTITSLNGR
ncbi:G-type lectin S-receptor-like serine/threonine-protein kinase At4g27290 [Abrus precatorius]|uniref:non-specific serine/threonine protein kinase n=1 Tax=Abrus precatorius TaxID=3816 RepID=A0A8B8LG62_ABRPR|nr:G-type lectin S-receptor-like serine/threonine-protein kinase At4g27290 [Abrus precatorius]